MKRPQFGLRLMLLIVALLATIFAWQSALQQQRREARLGELSDLQVRIIRLEKYLTNIKEHPAPLGWTDAMKAEVIDQCERQISAAKKRFDELSKSER